MLVAKVTSKSSSDLEAWALGGCFYSTDFLTNPSLASNKASKAGNIMLHFTFLKGI